MARTRGWTRADIVWERIQESANRQYLAGRPSSAAIRTLAGYVLARLAFNRSDPRSIASCANLGFGMGIAGMTALSGRLYDRAWNDWQSVPDRMDELHILPRARSSLHHQRMEMLYWNRYRQNVVNRLQRFVSETDECLRALLDRKRVPHRLYSRWRGEKLPIFDDSRKLLAACLLVIADEVDGSG